MYQDNAESPVREMLAIELAQWRGHGLREKTYDEADRILALLQNVQQPASPPQGDIRQKLRDYIATLEQTEREHGILYRQHRIIDELRAFVLAD